MIYADKINLSYGSQTVFDDVSFSIQSDQKVGLVGRNGSGKSTLLRALSDPKMLDSGRLQTHRDKKIAYLPQEVVLESNCSVLEETVRVGEELSRLLDRAKELQAKLTTDNVDASNEYAEIQNELADRDLTNIQVKAKQILHGLGFTKEQLEKSVSTLSVGWKMRVVLAKLLLQDADFYLFDEPTNHLDIIAKEWFLSFLKNASFGFLLVCHERYFLNELCTHILELDRGKGVLYTGNFDKYVAQKEHSTALVQAAYDNQQKEIKRKKVWIAQNRAKTSKAKMAQSMMRELEKMVLIVPPSSDKDIAFTFNHIKKSGRTVLTVNGVGHTFANKKIFSNVSFEIEIGQKVAIVAANGVGKTTLLNIITGKIPKQTGTISFGFNVKPAFFEQDQNKMLSKKRTILENVNGLCPQTSEHNARTMLGSFLFSNDDVDKKVSVLSGGEKNRVGMAVTLLQNGNFLLLDEPTNHLDIQSKERLLKALQTYPGTILFVSHDRDFVNDLATHIIELTPNGAHFYHGNFDSYIYQKSLHAKKTLSDSQEKKSKLIDLSSKQMYELRKQAAKLERMIEKKEKETVKLELQFAKLSWGTPKYQEAEKKLSELKEELTTLTDQWETVLKKLI